MRSGRVGMAEASLRASASALVVGESLVDVVVAPDGSVREYPGGSPANVAVAMARLGGDIALATAYASDRLGRLLDAHFATAGVGLVGVPYVLARTSTAKAVIGRDGAATYDFDVEWDLPLPRPERTPMLVHTGSLAAVLEPGAGVVLDLVLGLADSSTVSVDVNARPAATGAGPAQRQRIERLVAVADLVQASDEDLAAYWPELSVEAATAHLLSLGAGAVAVTRGDGGALCRTPAGLVEVAATPVPVVDTIGAGDTFCAALLDGLRLRGLLGGAARSRLRALPLDDWRAVVARANRAAAITVSRAGPNPPTAAELDAATPAWAQPA